MKQSLGALNDERTPNSLGIDTASGSRKLTIYSGPAALA